MENIFTDEYFMKKALQEAEMALRKAKYQLVIVVVIIQSSRGLII
jgi:tRNA(adenine34) deaminase